MATPGMLGGLFAPQPKDLLAEQRAEEQDLRALATMDPFQQAGYASLAGSKMAGKGLGSAAALATGHDPRSASEKHTAAVQAAKEEAAALGFDPEDPKTIDAFYKNVISILRSKGLINEAMIAAREWEAKKQADAKAKLEIDELGLRKEDLERKRAADLAKAATEQGRLDVARRRNDILAKQGVPEFQRWAESIEAEVNPEIRKRSIDAFNAKLESMGKGVMAVDRGDKVDIIDRADGALIRTDDKAMKPKDAAKDKKAKEDALNVYEEYVSGLQRHYDAAVQLHNHRGLPSITGKLGKWKGEPGYLSTILTMIPGVTSDDALGAIGKYDQVAGGTFLAGLSKLKAASQTGSTGLGAVSEKEGDKVQADAAALNRYQQAPDFRSSLAAYLHWLEGHAERAYQGAVEDAQALGRPAPPRLFVERQLETPRGQAGKETHPALKDRAPKPTVQQPSQQPAAGVVRWVRGPDGKPMPEKAK